MKIAEFEHNDENALFWARMGPFFASSKVRKAVGGFMTSGPAFTWWVAFDDDNHVMGFVAAKRERGGSQVYLTYAYTLPEHRGKGVYTALFAARMKAISAWEGVKRIHAICSASSVPMMLANGFQECGKRGQFSDLERIL